MTAGVPNVKTQSTFGDQEKLGELFRKINVKTQIQKCKISRRTTWGKQYEYMSVVTVRYAHGAKNRKIAKSIKYFKPLKGDKGTIRRSSCHAKQCGSSAVWKHGRKLKDKCCEHEKRKAYCKESKECGGSTSCEQGKQKAFCKQCGGSAICEHGKRKYQCKECGGSAICEHEKRNAYCKECDGLAIYEHGKDKAQCKKCESDSAFAEQQRSIKLETWTLPVSEYKWHGV